MPSHCRRGGWLLGNGIDGTQAELVRIPFADNGLLALSPLVSDEAALPLSCAFPTSLECGVLAAAVQPGDRVAIVGAGPVGLATLMTAALYTPSQIIVVDTDTHRLETALSLGATQVVAGSGAQAVKQILDLTQGEGVDAAIEAVGLPQTFDLCQGILSAGGHLANMGVHSASVSLHLERLWSTNISVTTRLVDAYTTSMLLRLVKAGQLEPSRLISHRFAFRDIVHAYETFSDAARNKALKVVVSMGAEENG
jgi:alcohol dehydrogenase